MERNAFSNVRMENIAIDPICVGRVNISAQDVLDPLIKNVHTVTQITIYSIQHALTLVHLITLKTHCIGHAPINVLINCFSIDRQAHVDLVA